MSNCLCASTPVLKCKACSIEGLHADAPVCAALAKYVSWGQISQAHMDVLLSKTGTSGARTRLELLCGLEQAERVIELLAEFKRPAQQGEGSYAREQRLAELQNTIDLWDWADGSPICAKSYMFHVFGLVFDHKCFKWSNACNQWCNEPRLSVIIPISDNLKNVKWVHGFVISGWLMLDEPITLKDGTTLRFRIRFLKGDAPLQQKRHGVNTGNAHFRCWLCDAHMHKFVDLTHCAEHCKLRDLHDLEKSAAKAGCTHGDHHLHPRTCPITDLRLLLRKLGIKGVTGAKRASLENTLISHLKGVNSKPGLLGDSDISIEDVPAIRHAEGVADEPLHVIKGLLDKLRALIKEKLSVNDRARWIAQENEVDGGKEEYSGQDYRKWLYASPSMWRVVEAQDAVLENLQQVTINVAHAVRFCFRQAYPGWHSQHGKIVLRAISYIYKCAPANGGG